MVRPVQAALADPRQGRRRYAAKGVKLAKIDVDKDKLLAAQFRIQSIPTVYAIYRGQPVADLTNYRSEGQIKKVLDQLLAQLKIEPEGATPQAEIEPLIAMAEQVLGEGDAARAVNIFRQVHEMAPEDAAVIGGLARALIANGEADEARAAARRRSAKSRRRSRRSRVRARRLRSHRPLRLPTPADWRPGSPQTPTTMKRGSSSPRQKWRRDRDAAADALLEIIRRDREWNEGAPRQRFLQLLEAQGLEDPWSSAQRRRLSAVLFT